MKMGLFVGRNPFLSMILILWEMNNLVLKIMLLFVRWLH